MTKQCEMTISADEEEKMGRDTAMQMPLQTDACERGEPCTRQLEVDAPADQQLLTGLPLLEQIIP